MARQERKSASGRTVPDCDVIEFEVDVKGASGKTRSHPKPGTGKRAPRRAPTTDNVTARTPTPREH